MFKIKKNLNFSTFKNVGTAKNTTIQDLLDDSLLPKDKSELRLLNKDLNNEVLKIDEKYKELFDKIDEELNTLLQSNNPHNKPFIKRLQLKKTQLEKDKEKEIEELQIKYDKLLEQGKENYNQAVDDLANHEDNY